MHRTVHFRQTLKSNFNFASTLLYTISRCTFHGFSNKVYFKDYKIIDANNKKKCKYERLETLEDLDEEFDIQRTFKEAQEILEQCYQDIKHKLNVQYSNDEFRVKIMIWFSEKRLLLPHRYQMKAMLHTYISWQNIEVNDDEHMTMEQLDHCLYPGHEILVELGIHEEEFFEQQTLDEKTFEQKTIDRCYEDMKHKFNVRSSDIIISVTILKWYIDKRHALPRVYLMNGMVGLFIC